MIQPTTGKGTWLQRARAINNSSRNMGLYVLGGRGTGKSWLLALVLAWQDFLAHRPQVLFLPLASTGHYFLSKLVRILTYLPASEHAKVWERIVYCDLSGRCGFVSPFPVYYCHGAETLQEMNERYLQVIELSNPTLLSQAPISYPAMHRLGVQAGTVLAACGYQLSELEDLLFHPLEWEQGGRFDEAVRRYPEDATPAVEYFRQEYLPMSRSDKSKVRSLLLDHVFRLTSDRYVRAVFCAQTPGIDWQEVSAKGQTVILDFSRISNPQTKRFAMLWTFQSLYEFVKKRDRSDQPFGIIIDEFASLTNKVATGTNPLATLLDEFIQQYMRNANIFLTVAHQTIQQLDDQLRQTVLSLGNYLFGQAPTMEAARLLADALFLRDPWWVKYWHPIFGRVSPWDPLTVIAQRPEFLPLDQQQEVFAGEIRRLKQWEFLLRPAVSEGEIGTAVVPLTIPRVGLDPATGEYDFPDPQLLDSLYPILAAKSGMPVTAIRKEQDARLTHGTIQKPGKPQPAAGGGERQPAQLPDGTQPEPRSVRETQSRPTLDDQQKAFLARTSANPDTPVSLVYKKLGVGVALGTKIRDRLKAHGLIAELEVRTGRTGAGRPAKVVIPTFQALELIGKEPPPGQGGVLHRHIQHWVQEGALAKGYSAQCEKDLGNGGIVDVHLENGQVRIAVEIAVVSTPGREIGHIRNCLDFGYDQVFTLFADETLLVRTQRAVQEAFSAQEAGRVRLLPLSQLSHVG